MLLIEIKQQTNSEKVNIKKYNVAVIPLTKNIIEGGRTRTAKQSRQFMVG